MALAKSHRLSLRFERERLTKTGKTSFGKYFTLVSVENNTVENIGSRFAILLSKKISSLAVDRNKIKRITSHLIEENISFIPPKDYLVIPKRQVLEEKTSSLREDIKSLFLK